MRCDRFIPKNRELFPDIQIGPGFRGDDLVTMKVATLPEWNIEGHHDHGLLVQRIHEQERANVKK